MRTAKQVVDYLQEGNPNLRFAISEKEDAVAIFLAETQAWATLLTKAITGQWISVTFEILANDKPVWPQSCWREYKGQPRKTEGHS